MSSDKDETSFDSYFATMPFVALPYSDRARQKFLNDTFHIEGIPTLIFLDGKSGKLITAEGHQEISSQAFIQNFPYSPTLQAASYFSDDELKIITRAQTVLKECATFSKEFCEMSPDPEKFPREFSTFLYKFLNTAQSLTPSSMMMIPGGWRNKEDTAGDLLMHILQRNYDNSFNFSTHNSGRGSDYHQSSNLRHPDETTKASFVLENIPAGKILDEGFWYMFFMLQARRSEKHTPEVLYELLIPHLTGKPVVVALADQKCSASTPFRKPQRSETCYSKNIMECYRFLLLQLGLSPSATKQVTFSIRREMVRVCTADLLKHRNAGGVMSPSESFVVSTACQQLARCSVKEFDAKRIDGTILAQVRSEIDALNQLRLSVESTETKMQSLIMEKYGIWRPFPEFATMRASESVEKFAGKPLNSNDKNVVDFVSLNRKVENFQEARAAIKKCLCLCTQVARKDNAAQYFFRSSLIQSLVCEVLPVPAAPVAKYEAPGSYKDAEELPEERATKPKILTNVELIMDMGMSREQAWAGLIHANGNYEVALNYIFDTYAEATQVQWNKFLQKSNLAESINKWFAQIEEDKKNEKKSSENELSAPEMIPSPLEDDAQRVAENVVATPVVPQLESKSRLETPAERDFRLCIWSHAKITREDQLGVLNELYELTQHYVASSKSVQGNRSFRSAQAIVMTSILAITDCIVRLEATDQPSLLSMILNGSIHLYEPPKQDLLSLFCSKSRDFLVTNRNARIPVKSLKGKIVGLYFSASWCGPCRQFTPMLATLYNELKSLDRQFEIIFISSDRDASTFSSYFDHMPWLALPYAERNLANEISAKFEVKGIPSLVLLNGNGSTLHLNGRSAVMNARGQSEHGFPWGGQPLSSDDVDAAEAVARGLVAQQKAAAAARAQVVLAEKDAQVGGNAFRAGLTRPQYFLSIKSGSKDGQDFSLYSRSLECATPELAERRGFILDYFTAHEKRAERGIFQFRSFYNCTFSMDKKDGTVRLVAKLCDLVGVDLNPSQSCGGPSVDDAKSFVENVADQMCSRDEKNPFVSRIPEFGLFRDITILYKLLVANTEEHRSIKLANYERTNALMEWQTHGANQKKTECYILVSSGFEPRHVPMLQRGDPRGRCWLLDRTEVPGVADARTYLSAFKRRAETEQPTEDDVLHELSLPSFNERLNEENAETLLSLLTVPYMRIPLVMAFFATKEHVNFLLSRDLQQVLQSVLFEPRNWVSRYHHETISEVPLSQEQELVLMGAPHGMLLQELLFAPDAFCQSLLLAANLVLKLDTGSYKSGTVDCILFMIRLVSRVEQYILHAVSTLTRECDITGTSNAPFRSQTERAAILACLRCHRTSIRAFLQGPARGMICCWLQQSQRDNNMHFSCTLVAHEALLFRGVQENEFDSDSAAALLSSLVFLQTWYCPGRDAEAPLDPHESKAEELDIVALQIKQQQAQRKAKADSKKTEVEISEEAEAQQLVGKTPLLVPDYEIYDILQKSRAGLLKFFGSSNTAARNSVLDLCLSSATRGLHSRSEGTDNWTALPGAGASVWRLATIEVNVQTAEVFLGEHRVVPLENRIARDCDFLELFGREPQHCALVAQSENRKWVRLVGRNYNLKYWKKPDNIFEGVLHVPTEPGIRASDIKEWQCFQCFYSNPEQAEACGNPTCSLFPPPAGPGPRGAPKFRYGLTYNGREFPRLYIPPNLNLDSSMGDGHEQWLWDMVEPVMIAFYGEHPRTPGTCFREKMNWELYLPAQTSPADKVVHLIGCHINPKEPAKNTWKNVVVMKDTQTVLVYALLEHGRRSYRSLIYSSNARFSLLNMNPDVEPKKLPPHPDLRFATGDFKATHAWKSSLVISRTNYETQQEETYIPSRLLSGSVPAVLLENFFFWQRSHDHSLRGYPKDMTNPRWHFKCRIHILSLPELLDDRQVCVYQGVVSQLPLQQSDYRLHQERTGELASAELKHQGLSLEVTQNMRQDKVRAIMDLGFSKSCAETALDMFHGMLEAAQDWLSVPENAASIFQGEFKDDKPPVESGSVPIPIFRQVSGMSQPSISRQISETEDVHSHHLVLLDLLNVPRGCLCWRIAQVLTRIEDLSHILCWTTSGLGVVGAPVSIALIELPRLNLKFRPVAGADGKVRLCSMEYDGLFISDRHVDLPEWETLSVGIPFSVLLESPVGELLFLVSNAELSRPVIYNWPFSTHIVPLRSSDSWMHVMETRFFLYPVHISRTYLQTPTQSSAVYMIQLMLLHRQYTEAMRVVQSCEADRKLAPSEAWLLNGLKKTVDDWHPDAFACRLKLSLVTMNCKEQYPWEIQKEFSQYLSRLSLVSKICLLSADEERYLLKHIASGAAELQHIQDQWQSAQTSTNQNFLENRLNNRLAILSGQSEPQLLQSHSSLSGDNRDGKMNVSLQKSFQKGSSDPWQKVLAAVVDFFGKSSNYDRAWTSLACYRKTEDSLVGAAAVTKLKFLWDDEITGQRTKLGFLFLIDLLLGEANIPGSLKMSITGHDEFQSRCLASLLARLMFGSSTTWGRLSNLRVHCSQDELSFVPYIFLALLETASDEDRKTFPALLLDENGGSNLASGLSTTSVVDDPNNAPSNITLCSWIEDKLTPWCERRANSRPWRAYVAARSELSCRGAVLMSTCHEVFSFHSLLPTGNLPQVQDYACSQRVLKPFCFDFEQKQIELSPQAIKEFSFQLLTQINIDDFVLKVPRSPTTGGNVVDKLPFDLSNKPEAKSAVAMQLVSRLAKDTKNYSEEMNSGTRLQLSCLSESIIAVLAEGKSPDEAKILVSTALGQLNCLTRRLEAIREHDAVQIPIMRSYILTRANDVKSGAELSNQPFAKERYLLLKHCGRETECWLEFLTAALLSSSEAEICRLNPFVSPEQISQILQVMIVFCLRVNRIGLINRVIAEAISLMSRLQKLQDYDSWAKKMNLEERMLACKVICINSESLAGSINTKRFTIDPINHTFDPRMVVFEYMFDVLLRKQQTDLLDKFLGSSARGASCVEQMIMGAGKTSVISPLLSLILADGEKLLTLCVPDSLLDQSRSLMRERFTRIVPKRIHSFSFDRNIKHVRNVTQLVDKLNDARKTKGIVVTTPDAIKSLMLKFLECLTSLCNVVIATAEDKEKYQRDSDMADELSKILRLWKVGTLVLDEVDLLLHPLRSELNFPIGEKVRLDLYVQRYQLPMHLFDAFFYAQTREISGQFSESSLALQLLAVVEQVVFDGIRLKVVQTSPHLVITDKDWYASNLMQPMAAWLLLWLRANNYISPVTEDLHALYFLQYGVPPLANDEAKTLLEARNSLSPTDRALLLSELAKHSEEQVKVLNLAHDWLFSYLPHCLGKINRVSYGLLNKEQVEAGERNNMPASRGKVAVPFIGKDVPSPCSEFAHPDVLVGLTVLAYRIEGMREFDVRKVVQSLQKDMNEASGPILLRPACVTFSSWVSKSKAYYQRQFCRLGSSRLEADLHFEGNVMELPLFQIGDTDQMTRLVSLLRNFPPTVHFCLEMVFREVLNHARTKLSASGQELGGEMLFCKRFGFSGTPSDLMPKELGPCGFEPTSEGKIMSVLTNSDVVSYEEIPDWTVHSLLIGVCTRQPRPHALIDTGALITGMANEEVARFLLDHGLDCDGVVYFDQGKQILVRETGKSISMSQNGIPKERYFTFYDQVNTTGQDVKIALNGCAIQTLGKDMTFRDYSQGAFRMRQIGTGQTIHLYIIPEVLKLICSADIGAPLNESKSGNQPSMIAQVAGWLMLNSMRSEQLQFMQLCIQNMSNIYRKSAFSQLLADFSCETTSNVGPRFLRFQQAKELKDQSNIALYAIQLFEETLQFDISCSLASLSFSFRDFLFNAALKFHPLFVDVHNSLEIADVLRDADGSVGGVNDLGEKDLGAQMQNEQEQVCLCIR